MVIEPFGACQFLAAEDARFVTPALRAQGRNCGGNVERRATEPTNPARARTLSRPRGTPGRRPRGRRGGGSQPELALDLHLLDAHGHELSAREFILQAHAGRKGQPHAHAHELLDGLDRGQLDVDVERRAMPDRMILGRRFRDCRPPAMPGVCATRRFSLA